MGSNGNITKDSWYFHGACVGPSVGASVGAVGCRSGRFGGIRWIWWQVFDIGTSLIQN